jgi:transposase
MFEIIRNPQPLHHRKSATNAPCSATRRLQMAPNLPASQHALIQHMIDDGRFTNRQIAKAAHCSIPAVKAIKRNLRDFGSTTAPPNGGGRPPSMTSVMRDALLEYLLRKPNLYLDEMVVYLWDEFGHHITKSSISRTLRSAGWSKKNARRIAKEQNADLRDFYLHSLSSFRSYQLVYVDESGCDTAFFLVPEPFWCRIYPH